MAEEKIVIIEATVPTGFEEVARDEAVEKFGLDCKPARGKITFRVPFDRVKQVLQLGGIDNCRVQMINIPKFGFTEDDHDCLSRLQLMVKDVDWAEGLTVWREFFSFQHPIPPVPENIPTDEEIIDVCIMKRKQEPSSGGKKSKQKKGRKDKRKDDGRKEKGERQQKEDTESVERSEQEGKENGSVLADAIDVCGQTSPPCRGEGDTSPMKIPRIEGDALPDMTSSDRKAKPEQDDVPKVEIKSSEEALIECSTEGASSNTEETSETSTKGGEEALSISNTVCETSQVSEDKTKKDPASKLGLAQSESQRSIEKVDSDGIPSAELKSAQQKQNICKTGLENEADPDPGVQKPARDPTKPVFRVTCNRAGEHHSFDSMSAAASFGSAVQTYFGWNVDMKNFNIEVILNIDNEEVSVGIGLTQASLHYRNLVAFGVTTLRPTICYNMLRMCKIRDGHVVCDPMCGSGSIPIQGALSWPKTLQLCGENFPKALEKTGKNKQAVDAERQKENSGTLKMDIVRWDACHLPLRDGAVDIFVTDLPFGHRVGSKTDNRKLYPRVLEEMARVGRFGARACLLTGDKNNFIKAIQQTGQYWQRRRILSVNIGGIAAGVFLLLRTTTPFLRAQNSPPKHHAHVKSRAGANAALPAKGSEGRGTTEGDSALVAGDARSEAEGKMPIAVAETASEEIPQTHASSTSTTTTTTTATSPAQSGVAFLDKADSGGESGGGGEKNGVGTTVKGEQCPTVKAADVGEAAVGAAAKTDE